MTARRPGSGRQRACERVDARLLRRWPLPEVDQRQGKESRGCILAVGGSREVPGAILLSALGALRAGAGKLQIATVSSVAAHVAVAVPEARVIGLRESRKGEIAAAGLSALRTCAEAADSVLLGPGMADAASGVALARSVVRPGVDAPLVLDAAALHVLDHHQPLSHGAGVIAVPHPGEMASLWGCDKREVTAHPLELARIAAKTLNVIMVLKGDHTFIATPDGRAFENTAGNAGLGTSGSGDTLSGVIAGLLARGAAPDQAAVWGVYLHARAGDLLAQKIAPLGFLARELLDEVPTLLRQLTPRGS